MKFIITRAFDDKVEEILKTYLEKFQEADVKLEVKEPPAEIREDLPYSSRQRAVFVEINSLEELLKFQRIIGERLILFSNNVIEIYDDYRE